MSGRPGNPQQITAPVGVLGSANGRAFALGPQWVVLVGFVVTLNTTATPGIRTFAMRVQDAAGNLIWYDSSLVDQLGPSGTGLLFTGVCLSNTLGHGPLPPALYLAWLLPNGFAVPPNSSLIILDLSNIDPNDTVQLNSAALLF